MPDPISIYNVGFRRDGAVLPIGLRLKLKKIQEDNSESTLVSQSRISLGSRGWSALRALGFEREAKVAPELALKAKDFAARAILSTAERNQASGAE